MDERLSALIDRQIKRIRQERNRTFELSLSQLAEKEAAEGRFSSSSHVNQIQQCCEEELKERVNVVWAVYERVLRTANPPSDGLCDMIMPHIENEISEFHGQFLDKISRTVNRAGGGFDMGKFFIDPGRWALEHIRDEIELFAEHYRSRLPSVSDILKAPRYAGPRDHWEKAEAFFESIPPDLANASKEAISAVEGIAKIVTGDKKMTLGKCVDLLRDTGRIPPGMAKSLHGLWGFVSESPGVRHGAPVPSDIDEAQAKYVMDSAGAAIAYLAAVDG